MSKRIIATLVIVLPWLACTVALFIGSETVEMLAVVACFTTLLGVVLADAS